MTASCLSPATSVAETSAPRASPYTSQTASRNGSRNRKGYPRQDSIWRENVDISMFCFAESETSPTCSSCQSGQGECETACWDRRMFLSTIRTSVTVLQPESERTLRSRYSAGDIWRAEGGGVVQVQWGGSSGVERLRPSALSQL